MTQELPEPFSPSECDLRDYTWMPLDLTRLFTSESWMLGTDAQRCAALRLWGASWHQVPAGSLPQNEKMLRILSERYDDWSDVKEHALRGWILCSDGRLYHPVVSEKANEAWALKLARISRTEAARQAKAAKKSGTEGSQAPPQKTVTTTATDKVTDIATRRVTSSVTTPVAGSNRPDQTRPDLLPPITPPSPHRPIAGKPADTEFEQFWSAYPRKVGKDAARKAFAGALKRASLEAVAAGLNAATWPEDPQFIPHPATWLNQGRWADDPAAAAPRAPPPVSAYDARRAASDAKMRAFLERAVGESTDAQPRFLT